MKDNIYSAHHKAIASKLKLARLGIGLTQAEAAKSLGISQSYLSKLESGQIRIAAVQLKDFSKLYKKNLNYFIA